MCSGASVWPQLRQDKHFILVSIVIQHVNTQFDDDAVQLRTCLDFPVSTAPTVSDAAGLVSGGRGDEIIKVTSLDPAQPAQPSPARSGDSPEIQFKCDTIV